MHGRRETRQNMAFVAFFVLLFFCSEATGEKMARNTSARRRVAVTVDDLPATREGTLESKRMINSSLLEKLQKQGIPAIGFVNEKKLGIPEAQGGEIALLQAWLDASMELGNHTFSHPSFFSTPLEKFKSEVIQGAKVTNGLLEARGQRLQYFRHPYLNTGPDLATKTAFEDFLKREGYTIAPVTLDNSEWMYAQAYEVAQKRHDSELSARIVDEYIRYMARIFDFYEKLSRELFDREIPQVLLLHTNQLNADYLDELALMIRERGYEFISLGEALKDPAYRSSDQYVGRNGISWLQRWSITRGNPWREEPEVPDWIQELRL